AVFGGPRKSLKTSLMLDLIVSLASGKTFLGVEAFGVPKPCKVACLSGESGEAVLQDATRAICAVGGPHGATEALFLPTVRPSSQCNRCRIVAETPTTGCEREVPPGRS